MSADKALAAAMRAALMAHADVKAVLGETARIYDDPPPDPVFPYVTLGRLEARPADASEAEAIEHAVTVHIWSRHGGRGEALDAIAAIRKALHNSALTLTGRKLVLMLVSFTDVFRSGDGRTTHGVARIRAITEPE